MSIEVVAASPLWAHQFAEVSAVLRAALAGVPGACVEHVGSTSVSGLAAKPVLDIDVIVAPADVPAAVEALAVIGYVHRGDLGVAAGRRSARRTTPRGVTSTSARRGP